MRFIMAGAMLVGMASGATAQSGESCARVDDGAERLLCYDGVFRVKRETAPSQETDWRVNVTTSRLDDSTNVVLALDSVEQIPGRFMGRKHAQIYIRCQENTTSMYFVMGDQFLSDIQGYGEVTYRLDTQPAQKRSMTSSTDHQALGLWSGGGAISFIRSMFGAENMLVQITPFSESAVTADFRIAGLEQEITPLREACGW